MYCPSFPDAPTIHTFIWSIVTIDALVAINPRPGDSSPLGDCSLLIRFGAERPCASALVWCVDGDIRPSARVSSHVTTRAAVSGGKLSGSLEGIFQLYAVTRAREQRIEPPPIHNGMVFHSTCGTNLLWVPGRAPSFSPSVGRSAAGTRSIPFFRTSMAAALTRIAGPTVCNAQRR